IAGTGNFIAGRVHIDDEASRGNPHQYQHHQADPFLPGVSKEDQNLLKKLRSDMLSTIEYAPVWIIMAVALALGIGTMIGWRRVAMTIGEKIGKRGMTYAQG
ncbi:inorganic phosphate transporter, partial [Escherichia coli]|uniref:inorganic phosphate transporter n=1 Tax=Escherichia coli TaxID=562 RepID=UPI003F50F862